MSWGVQVALDPSYPQGGTLPVGGLSSRGGGSYLSGGSGILPLLGYKTHPPTRATVGKPWLLAYQGSALAMLDHTVATFSYCRVLGAARLHLPMVVWPAPIIGTAAWVPHLWQALATALWQGVELARPRLAKQCC